MIFNGNQVYFFKNLESIVSYNNDLNKFNLKLLKVIEYNENCCFKLLPHMKG